MPPKYDYPFDPTAANNTAATVYALARRGGERVLDIGSGPGIVSAALSGADGRHVVCLDSDADALAVASAAGVEQTHVVDLRSPDWCEPVVDQEFDVVVLADVLEHLVEPELVLRALRDRNLIAPDGRLVVSIPNGNHLAVLAELLAGTFTYTDTGLLDRTHVRWFTGETITRLLNACGFEVVEVHRTLRLLEQTAYGYRADQLPEPARTMLAVGGGSTLEQRTYQYVLLARPTGDAVRSAELAADLDRARADAWTTRRELTGERDRAVAELDRVRGTAADDVTSAGERVAALAAERDAAAASARESAETARAAAGELAAAAALAAQRDAELAAAREAITQVTARLAGAEADVDDGRAAVAEAHREAAASAAALSSCEKDLARTRRALADLRGSRTLQTGAAVRRVASPVLLVGRLVRGGRPRR